MTRSRRLALALLLVPAGVCLLTAGCGRGVGRDRLARPTGRVTYRGEPIRRAYIYFSPRGEGLAASGEVTDGRVAALTTLQFDDGILPGKYRVAVLAMPKPVDASDVKAASFQETVDPVVTTKGTPVPAKYCNVDGSPLVVDVAAGMSNFEFDLKD